MQPAGKQTKESKEKGISETIEQANKANKTMYGSTENRAENQQGAAIEVGGH